VFDPVLFDFLLFIDYLFTYIYIIT
jgi:hypothetical protein